MKIEVLEERLKVADPVTGRFHDLEQEDRITVSDEAGKQWCDAGWVKDLSGEYPTAERKPGAHQLVPGNARHDAEGGS